MQGISRSKKAAEADICCNDIFQSCVKTANSSFFPLSYLYIFLLSLLFPTVLPDYPDAGLEDERCPLMTGCDRAGGQCVCDARHSCLGSFTYPDQETCMKASKSGKPSLFIPFHVKRQMCVAHARAQKPFRGDNAIYWDELIHNRCGSEVANATWMS